MKRALLVLVLSLISTSAMAEESAMAKSGHMYNARIHPISLAVGMLNLGLDFLINDQWTLGPEGTYWNVNYKGAGTSPSSIDINASSVGLRGNWFRNGVYTDGLYVGPFVRYAKFGVKSTGNTTVTGDASGVYAGSMVGYGWFWDSFNMMVGGGASVGSGQTNIVVTEASGERKEIPNTAAGFTAEYTLGWTF